jgi:ferritin-like protein
MTNRELIQARFYEFVFKSMDDMKNIHPEMKESEAAFVVMSAAFDALSKTWMNAYGAEYMAEYFYRVADSCVEISNKEPAK